MTLAEADLCHVVWTALCARQVLRTPAEIAADARSCGGWSRAEHAKLAGGLSGADVSAALSRFWRLNLVERVQGPDGEWRWRRHRTKRTRATPPELFPESAYHARRGGAGT